MRLHMVGRTQFGSKRIKIIPITSINAAAEICQLATEKWVAKHLWPVALSRPQKTVFLLRKAAKQRQS
jgi:hypothetical protein